MSRDEPRAALSRAVAAARRVPVGDRKKRSTTLRGEIERILAWGYAPHPEDGFAITTGNEDEDR